jgi:hypothetical protein
MPLQRNPRKIVVVLPVMPFERRKTFANAAVALLVTISCWSNVEPFVQVFPQLRCVYSLPKKGGTSYYHALEEVLFSKCSCRKIRRISSLIEQAKSSSDGGEDDDDEVMLQNEDWRAFRAKLVMGEQKSKKDKSSALQLESTTAPAMDSDAKSGVVPKPRSNDNVFDVEGDLDGIGSLFPDHFAEEKSKASTGNADISIAGMTPLDPSQWAYDSGDVIEQGAVILGGVEQEFGFGLRQQYFHKAAILVLDHTDTFTKGIILNRPTDLTLEDDVNPKVQWRVWFGGDVEGLHASHPDIVCLHSLKNEKAARASIPVMKDIQWTTFENAKVGIC